MPKEPSQSSLHTNTLFGHPKGLYVLFATEMWERFSFYGMRFILVLFLMDNVKGGFGWSKATAMTLYGLYSMFVYLSGVPGGIIADRYIGKKKAVLLGAFFQCVGHFLLAIHSKPAFFLGLVCLVIGTGLLKSNIAALVGRLYVKGDDKKQEGYSIFHMGVNIGSLLSAIAVGTVAENIGWHYGFGLAGLGMIIGVVVFLVFQHHIPNPKHENLQKDGTKSVSLAFGGIISAVAIVSMILYYMGWMSIASNYLVKYFGTISNLIAIFFTVLGIVFLAFTTIYKTKNTQERDRFLALSYALLLVFLFFIAYEQGGGLIIVYVKEYTQRVLFGWEIAASSVSSLNGIFVMLFGVFITKVLVILKKRNSSFNATFQMGLANLIQGCAFIFMLGAYMQKEMVESHKSSLLWIVGYHFLSALSDLCLIPVILSFANSMAPERLSGLAQGFVMVVVGLSHHYASQLGSLSNKLGERVLFLSLFGVLVSFGLLCMLVNKKIIVLTHSAEDRQS